MIDYKIKVPTSLKEITLEQYQLWMVEVINYNERITEGGEEISNVERLKLDSRLRQKMIEIFCGVPRVAVRGMLKKDYDSISNHLTTILEDEPELVPTFKFRGVEYGFIPNLQKKLTTGEWIDLDDFMKDWETYNKAMAILYRPVIMGPDRKGKYLIEDYTEEETEKNYEPFRQLPMSIVMGAVVFFYRISRTLLEITPKYLATVLEEKKELHQALAQNGAGINTYTRLLEETSLRWKKLLGAALVRPYSS